MMTKKFYELEILEALQRANFVVRGGFCNISN